MQQAKAGKRVFYAQFHTDYWDYLGWKDRFASKEANARHKEFLALAGIKQSYTPQVGVNGREYKSDVMASEVEKALRSDAAVSVKFQTFSTGKNKLTVKYELSGITEPSRLLISVVERGLVSDCKAGENKGKVLKHENTVRTFTVLDVAKDGRGEAALVAPDDLVRENSSVLCYVYSAKTGIIAGAEYADLNAAPDFGDPLPPFTLVETYAPVSAELRNTIEEPLDAICAKLQAEGAKIHRVSYYLDSKSDGEYENPFSLKAANDRFKALLKVKEMKEALLPTFMLKGAILPTVAELERKIESAAKEEALIEVKLELINKGKMKDKATIAYEISRITEPVTLTMCVVESKLILRLKEQKAEDDGGVGFSHVARSLKTVTIRKSGKSSMDLLLPKDVVPANSAIIAYTTDPKWVVTGGCEIGLE